jgi:simple sugar transport system ATP-binding protein
VDVKKTSQEQMAEMMVGRKVSFDAKRKQNQTKNETLLEIQNLTFLNKNGTSGLKNVSLSITSGEIVGIAGVDGNGQREFVQNILGITKPQSGIVTLKGKNISAYSIRKRITSGLGYIPEDRQHDGLVLDYTVEDNFVLKNYYQKPFSSNGILNSKEIGNSGNKILHQFDVRAGEGTKSKARSLSGGNQQKAIIGREFSLTPDVLIAVQPTRGLDVGAIEYIHEQLLSLRDSGRSVLLISYELDEILSLCDRIAVMYRGEIIDVVNNKNISEKELGLLMAGVKRGDKRAR